MRAIMLERRHIWDQAVRQAERLAAVHDPSGKMFNVRAVTTLEDGKVTTLENLARRQERQREKEAKAVQQAMQENGEDTAMDDAGATDASKPQPKQETPADVIARTSGVSKTQQRKLAKFEPRPPPPQPILPEGISVPDGEENFIELWDLPDGEVERRINREKRRKANTRKDLRKRQQAGKAERRLARDAKRKTYRDIKLVWKMINEERVKERTRMKSLEDEEAKKIAVEIAEIERARAMAVCESLGCTIENTEGTAEIEPSIPSLKGQQIDWSIVEQDHEDLEKVPAEDYQQPRLSKPSTRVDLSTAAKDNEAVALVPSSVQNPLHANHNNQTSADFLSLSQGGPDYHEHSPVVYNHKLRRKLKRALVDAQVRKEALVRQKAIAKFKSRGLNPPAILLTPLKPHSKLQPRILENGTLETQKQERIRTRMELADFNNASKVLRRQAKALAIEAGLRIHAEAMGRIPARTEQEIREEDEKATKGTGIGEQERKYWEEQFRTNFGAKSDLLET